MCRPGWHADANRGLWPLLEAQEGGRRRVEHLDGVETALMRLAAPSGGPARPCVGSGARSAMERPGEGFPGLLTAGRVGIGWGVEVIRRCVLTGGSPGCRHRNEQSVARVGMNWVRTGESRVLIGLHQGGYGDGWVRSGGDRAVRVGPTPAPRRPIGGLRSLVPGLWSLASGPWPLVPGPGAARRRCPGTVVSTPFSGRNGALVVPHGCSVPSGEDDPAPTPYPVIPIHPLPSRDGPHSPPYPHRDAPHIPRITPNTSPATPCIHHHSPRAWV